MLLDSLLGLAVITICGFLLLPIYIGMQRYEEKQQVELHAMQVLYSAIHFVKEKQVYTGQQQIDGRHYEWTYDDRSICVHYIFDGQEVERCISKTNQATH